MEEDLNYMKDDIYRATNVLPPKEKAWELLEKMNNSPITQKDWDNASDYAKNDLKRKVLIVIDEIQKIIPYNPATIINLKTNEVQEIMGFDEGSYYQEVKQEIEKL